MGLLHNPGALIHSILVFDVSVSVGTNGGEWPALQIDMQRGNFLTRSDPRSGGPDPGGPQPAGPLALTHPKPA
jgi:hypothetical protein